MKAWIKTVPFPEADEKLQKAIADARAVYPIEYATPVFPSTDGSGSIMSTHTLMPDALYHMFAGLGVMMAPDLPLRREQHEMIATMVSVTNRCSY
jgi:hypothetical protein